MDKLLINSVFLSALSLVFVASQAFSAAGDFKVSPSFKTKSVEYSPGSGGIASDTDSEVYVLAVNYGVTDKLSLTGSYSKTEMDADRADGVVTDADSDISDYIIRTAGTPVNGDDKSFGKPQLGATYRFNETVSVSAHVAEDIAREDIRGREFGFKFNIKI